MPVDLVSQNDLMTYHIESHGAWIKHKRLSYPVHAALLKKHTLFGQLDEGPFHLDIMREAIVEWGGFQVDGEEIPYDPARSNPSCVEMIPSFVVLGTTLRQGLIAHILSANVLARTPEGLEEALIKNWPAPSSGASDSPTAKPAENLPAPAAA